MYIVQYAHAEVSGTNTIDKSFFCSKKQKLGCGNSIKLFTYSIM